MNESVGCFEVVNSGTGQAAQLGMQGLWLTGRITPSGARLAVVHSFRSSEASPIEVVYAFGLPRDAALRRFRIEGADFRAHSELRPMEEARKEYERGIQQGSLSGLARTYRDGRVNLSVGNLRPGETVRVFLEMVAGVDLRDNGLRFRFPFTLAPCYHREARAIESAPGMGEIELPADQFGDLLLPAYMRDPSSLHAVSFDLSVVGGGKILTVASPSHTVKVTGAGSTGARVGLGVSKDVPDRDLVLDVETESGAAAVYGGACTEGGARFNVSIPSTLFDKQEDAPRTVVFILDRSGSMDGAALNQARKAAAACLATLSEQDRFGLLAFDDSAEVFQPHVIPATPENRRAGTQFLEAIKARGGTELGQALEAGLRLARGGAEASAPAQADLFVLTDGQVSGTEGIVSRFQSSGARIHCLGIGAASQDRFLTLLARGTGGVCRFLTPRERVDLGALDLFASVGRPLAGDVQVSFSGLEGVATVVNPPAAVFEGHPLVIMARAAGPGQGALHLAWAGGKKTRRIELSLDGNPEAETVRLLQGARLITDLDALWNEELEESAGGRSRETKRWRGKLENLGKEYGLANRAMSLVAVVERAGDDASKVPVTRVVPVGLPQDVAFESYFGAGGRTLAQFYKCSSDPAGYAEDSIVLKAARSPRFGKLRRSSSAPGSAVPKFLDRVIGKFARARTDAAPPMLAEEDLEGLLIRKFGESQDGGLAGAGEDVRLLRSLAALLILGLLGQSSQTGPFRVILPRLVAFVRPRLASITDANARRAMTHLVDAVEQGRVPDGPQNRQFAEAVAGWLEAIRVVWPEIAREWRKYLP
jgi:Ca-activated chloride channel homolog